MRHAGDRPRRAHAAHEGVIAVDLFGNVAPVRAIEALGVPVLEDAAQAAGVARPTAARRIAGRRRDALVLSVEEPGAFGDGGAVLARDDAVADAVRTLRFHGSRDKVTYDAVGYNSRLDELQAAILRVQLRELDRWTRTATAVAEWYAHAGLGEMCTLPVATDGARPAWHIYVVQHERADELAAALNERRHRRARLLPHADPPPAGDGVLRRDGRPARHRRARAHASRAARQRGDVP